MTVSSSSKSATYVANIDFLRAVAVLCVVAHHTLAATAFQIPYFGRLGGAIGVQLFFIISGYLICQSAEKHSATEYATHRFFRIFPAYLVAMFVVDYSLGGFVAAKIAAHPVWFALSALNLQQLYAAALLEMDVLHVTWTLTVELMWYLLAPLVVVAYRRFAWPTLALLACVSMAWSLAAAGHHLDSLYALGFSVLTVPVLPGQYEVIVGAAFPAQMVFFGMGAMVYRYREQALRIGTVPLLVCMLCCLALYDHYSTYILQPPLPLGIGLTAFFILMLRAPPLRVPFMAHIGQISYSIYLLHFPIIIWCFKEWGRFGPMHLVLTGVMVLVLSHLLYTCVERPGMALARILRPRRLQHAFQ